jgi:membrane associated rhomboid family serine protease
MKYATPPRLMWLGFILLVIGFLLPFLMVLRLLEPTLLLNFVAYFASLFGLIIGVIGIVTYTQVRKKDQDES